MMRLLTIVTLILASLWAGWWVVGSRGKELLIRRSAEEMRAAGWELDWEEMSVRGFPSRFDTAFEGLRARSPDGRLGWEAPFFQLLALSYRPNRVIAVFPPEQELLTPAGPVSLRSRDMRASAAVVPGRALELDRATLALRDLEWEGPLGGGALSAGQVAVRQAGRPERLDLAAFAADLAPSGLSGGTAGPLPAVLDRIDLDAAVTLDAPLALAAGGAPPRVEGIELRALALDWGDLELRLSGGVAVDGEGYPEGILALRAEGWRAAIAALEAAGALPEGQARLAEAFLEELAATPGGPVEAEVILSGGQARIGLIPLGPLPRLR